MTDEEIPDDPESDEADDGSFFDAGDAKQVRKRKKSIEAQQAEWRAWWQAALNSDVGRKCLWDILRSTEHFEDSPFMASPVGFPDTNATFFRMGKQDVGKRLFDDLLLMSPDNTLKMLQEHHPKFMKK